MSRIRFVSTETLPARESSAPAAADLTPAAPLLRCVKCFEKADLLLEGSSWCVVCLKEKLRTGG